MLRNVGLMLLPVAWICILTERASAQAAGGTRPQAGSISRETIQKQLEARRQQAQKQADASETLIRELVGKIAQSKTKSEIDDLNRRIKIAEKERGDAQFQVYRCREDLRNLDQFLAEYEAVRRAGEQIRRDEKALLEEVNRIKERVDSHNRDVAEQQRAVSAYSAIPRPQRTREEFDRLNRWAEQIRVRADELNRLRAELQGRVRDWENRRANLADRALRMEAKFKAS